MAPRPRDDDEYASSSSSSNTDLSAFSRLTDPLMGRPSTRATSLDDDDDDPRHIRSTLVSPAPSCYSLTESICETLYRYDFGRRLNNRSEVYKFPADEDEFDRQDRQHEMLELVMGRFIPPLADTLADDDPEKRKQCLDLGTGSGAWIIEVAREFPEAYCVAVDLVPMQSRQEVPPNVHSEVDDISLGLEHHYGGFDMIHTRFISGGICDYWALIDQVSRSLVPGGLADFTENDFRVYDLTYRPFRPPSFRKIWQVRPKNVQGPCSEVPWFVLWFTAIAQAARKRGAHIDAAALLQRWIRSHRTFEDIVYREYYIPICPWMFTRHDRSAILTEYIPNENYFRFRNFQHDGSRPVDAETMYKVSAKNRDCLLELIKSGRVLLLHCGFNLERLEEIENNARRELLEARIPLLIKVQNVYARKKQI